MSQWVLHLLGSPRLERDGTLVEIQRRKVMALLIYLAVTGKSHPRDSLAALFWPEHDQTNARAALRRTLSELQKILGEKLLLVEQDSIGLEHQLLISGWISMNFTPDLTAYRSHGHHPDDPCPDCLTALTEAVSLYKDDFLAGFTLSDSPGFRRMANFTSRDIPSRADRRPEPACAGSRSETARSTRRLALLIAGWRSIRWTRWLTVI